MRSVIQFLSDLRAMGVTLGVNGDKLTCNAPKNALTPEIRKELAERKIEILAFLESAQPWKGRETKENGNGRLPLSRAQQRVWFLEQMDPNSPLHNITIPFWLTGTLDVAALDRALRAVVERHESLRTGFSQQDGQPYAWVAEAGAWKTELADLRHLGAAKAEAEAMRMAYEMGRAPFDLEKPPLFRATVARVAEDRYLLLMMVQHLVMDAWSFGILCRQMTELYTADVEGKPSPLGEQTFEHRDYVEWERGPGQRLAEQQMPFWMERLSGDLTVPEVPGDRRRPSMPSFKGRRLFVRIDAELAERLRKLSRQMGTTLFNVLLAGFKALLLRYTGNEDILVGSNVANRPRQEFSTQIGFFVNNVLLRTDLSGNPTFAELVERVKETTRTAYANQNVPFDLLIERLHPERDLSRHSPLLQVMFTLENLPLYQPKIPGVKAEFIYVDLEVSGSDLAVLIWPEGPEYRCDFAYNTDLFDEATIRQMQRHYLRVLDQALRDPEQRIAALSLLDAVEREQLLREWNRTGAPLPGYATVVEWFRAQAAETPAGIAVAMGERALRYAELDAQSDRLARALLRRGVGRDRVVGLYVTRGIDMVVGLLGILKAGGAYLPLDPAFPASRLAYLIEDSGVGLILTEEGLRETERLRETVPQSGAQVLTVVEALAEDGKAEDADAAEAGPPRAGDLAYLIYTSGSTGQPKGTEIPHEALVNLLASMLREPGLRRGDTLVAVTTLSFDIAALEIFGPLVSGAKLVLASREQALDPAALAALLEESGATVLQATPSTWRMLVEWGWLGKHDLRMWCGGEPLTPELADSLLTRGRELWNLYGPTETTIWSAVHRVRNGEDPILVGRPIANTRMYILDGSGEPAPVGVAGELFIAGNGVARGYRNRPELTAERFVPEGFVPGAHMYRTGDLARYRRDGEIQLLGRTDQQIKLRGHRIELGEIEAALEQNEAVPQAVVIAHGEGANRRLVAYVRGTGKEKPEGALLRAWLQERLPDYMVPAQFVTLEEIPLTPNGKVDRSRLPAPEGQGAPRRATTVAPRNQTEHRVAAIWSEVLSTTNVGIRENFFDLGGHSLLLIRVHARLREEFQADIPVVDLFRHTTVEDLAAHLNRCNARAVEEGVPS